MTIAHDNSSNSGAENTATYSWSHPPTGTPRGVIVHDIAGDSTYLGADEVSGVTYGAETMVEVSGSPNLKTSGEDLGVSTFFLGSSVPTGSQTVEVTLASAVGGHFGVATTVTAADDTEVVTVGTSINSDAVADPSETLSLGGVESYAEIGIASGRNSPGQVTPLTGWTGQAQLDFGANVAEHHTYDTVGTADVTAGYTAGADDAVAISIAIRESAAAAVHLPPDLAHRPQHQPILAH